ncbi:unnamed protein product [Heterobilharzia americana]|nr:unnamed protein product [Heterobilharzia americana]
MSENALLVGQVDEVFDDIASSFKFYREAKNAFKSNGLISLKQWLSEQLFGIGLEVYFQDFSFSHDILSPIKMVNGSNLYAIMRSPSGGRTEALMIITSLGENSTYFGSLAYILSLSKLFRNQIHWAKDIIFLFPEYDYIGLMAWLEAYHGTANSNNLFWSELDGRSGSIQAGLNLEFADMYRPVVNILPEGPNGLLANLDMINTVVRLAETHSVETRVNHQSYNYARGTYKTRLNDMLGVIEAVWTQSTNSPTGLHGPLINYQIPAISLRANYKHRSTDLHSAEILSVIRLLEGILRSLNNLQERLHQSFWYYLLPNPYRYISIGVYMPPVLIMILSLLLKPLLFWIYSSKSKLNNLLTIQKKLDKSKQCKSSSTESDRHHYQRSDDKSVDNQSIRQRKIKLTTEQKDMNKLEDKQVETNKSNYSVSYSSAIPPHILGLILHLSLCFSMGFCLHSSPKYIFKLINLLIEYSLVDSTINPNDLFLVGIFGLIILMAVFLPIVMRILQRLVISCEKDKKVLVDQLCLLSWSLFLSCLACLNISSAIVLSIPIVPLLHLLVKNNIEVEKSCTTKLMKCFISFCCLLVCTPVFIILMCIINSYIEHQGHPTTLSVESIRKCFERCVLQSLVEADLFGCWTCFER